MSAEAVGHVYRHAPFTGATFTVLLAVADTVNDQHGNEFFMRLPQLASKCRMNRDTVRRSLIALVDAGWLEVVYRSSGKYPSRYRFIIEDGRPVVFEGRPNPRASRGQPAGEPRATRGDAAGHRNSTGGATRTRVRDVGAERAGRRALGLACNTCLDSRFIYPEGADAASPCPDCAPRQ